MKQILTAILAALAAAPLACGQARLLVRYGLEQGQVPSLEVPVYFNTFHANAPPALCGCFWIYGGGAGLVINATPHWSAVIDLARGHASNINGAGQTLTIFNYQVGPRYSYRNHSKWTPYGQALVGGSGVFSNYAIYGEGRNYFSATVGGGLNMRISNRVGFTVTEASWMFSNATNGLNQRQNNTKLATGITFRFLN